MKTIREIKEKYPKEFDTIANRSLQRFERIIAWYSQAGFRDDSWEVADAWAEDKLAFYDYIPLEPDEVVPQSEVCMAGPLVVFNDQAFRVVDGQMMQLFDLIEETFEMSWKPAEDLSPQEEIRIRELIDDKAARLEAAEAEDASSQASTILDVESNSDAVNPAADEAGPSIELPADEPIVRDTNPSQQKASTLDWATIDDQPQPKNGSIEDVAFTRVSTDSGVDETTNVNQEAQCPDGPLMSDNAAPEMLHSIESDMDPLLADDATIRQEALDLASTITDLKRKAEEKNETIRVLKQMRTDDHALEEENTELRRVLAEKNAELRCVTDKMANYDATQRENAALKDALDEIVDYYAIKKENADLWRDNGAIKKENEDLRRDHDATKKENARLHRMAESIQAQVNAVFFKPPGN